VGRADRLSDVVVSCRVVSWAWLPPAKG
jgi:hypothetical protein